MQEDIASIPAPGSQKEAEILIGVGRNIQYFHNMGPSEQDELLRILEAYECLGQVIKLLDWRLQQKKSTDPSLLADFLWLMRIYYLGLENFEKFAITAAKCTKAMNLPFAIIRIHIAERILGEENFREHVLLYSHLLGTSLTKTQQIPMLERLALLYEKKLFQEEKVNFIYHKLLETDANNIKALRFYKVLYMQTNQFQEAAEQLDRLTQVLSNPFEKQRAAHELAQIYLYNLNNAAKAREILETQCTGSQLDTHLTLIEALERLEAYDDLVSLLRQVTRETENPAEKASLEIRVSLTLLKAGKVQAAVEAARKAVDLAPKSFLAHEALLSVYSEYGDTLGIVNTLQKIREISVLSSSKSDLDRLIERGNRILALESTHA